MTTSEGLRQIVEHPARFVEWKSWLLQAAAELEALQKENAELKSKCLAWAIGVEQNNTDIVDMQRDEFKRIVALLQPTTDSVALEIIGICKRAIACIEQTVPVVVQRDQLCAQVAELRSNLVQLVEACGCHTLLEAHDNITQLHARVYELQRDKERLDWCVKNNADFFWHDGDEEVGAPCGYEVCWGGKVVVAVYKDLRSAIDAAMIKG